MARKVLKKINTRLNFWWRQSDYLNYWSKILFYNALVLHIDYGCTAWYPLFGKVLKSILQIAQNKCINFCLGVPPPSHISVFCFKKINWLSVEQGIELCTSSTVSKYWKRIVPTCPNNIFMSSRIKYNARLQMTWDLPLYRTNNGHKCISFLDPNIRNKLRSNIKTPAATASFTYNF